MTARILTDNNSTRTATGGDSRLPLWPWRPLREQNKPAAFPLSKNNLHFHERFSVAAGISLQKASRSVRSCAVFSFGSRDRKRRNDRRANESGRVMNPGIINRIGRAVFFVTLARLCGGNAAGGDSHFPVKGFFLRGRYHSLKTVRGECEPNTN